MGKCLSDDLTRRSRFREVAKTLRKRATVLISFSLLAIFFLLTSCGGGGGSDGISSEAGGRAVSTEVVSGVASAGARLAGQVTLRDASTPTQEKTTVIGSDGSFALDVAGMRGPYVLEATGSVNGVNYRLYSFADSPGTANINPLSNAVVAYAGRVNDPEEIYKNPDPAMLDKVKTGLPQAVADLLAKLNPLLVKYAADTKDPIKGDYKVDHTGLDALFDDVKFILANGILTLTDAKTGAVIFTCTITDIMSGYFSGDMPNLSLPAVPAGVTAAGDYGQVTVSWTAVSNATSYNLYWSPAPGVTMGTGAKIAGVTSPYVQAGLTPGTAYYCIVTAVNSAGESAPSPQASAMISDRPLPPLTLPVAPSGVTATGGTNQVTISWALVPGATSYNIYWSTASGVTTTNGTKIAGATSPAVQTGLSAGTTYNYIVTAVNSAGEGPASIPVAATTLTSTLPPAAPAAPTGVTATGGSNQVTISWPPVSGAASYNLYWSTASGVTPATGTKVAGATSPYVQTGLAAGTAYYYIVTALNSAGESASSAQVTATTTAPGFDALAYYNASCTGCHGAPSSFTGGRTAANLQSAIDSNLGGMMKFNTLTAAQVAAIAALLGP